ncbi:uncharacterized protein METZ01_LOCUS12106 [marine metagenome]|uniref:Uncharacterized protein n=1 Tax=marine metagenome TaxID=408172 RepID=A0A381NXC1_9ZZZZ
MGTIRPSPSDEEAAAIATAIELLWPRPAVMNETSNSNWRFSGRWWDEPSDWPPRTY